jgi:hypothetical protein
MVSDYVINEVIVDFYQLHFSSAHVILFFKITTENRAIPQIPSFNDSIVPLTLLGVGELTRLLSRPK